MIYFRLILISLFSLAFLNSYTQSFLKTPISGNYADDYIIVNYVDWSVQGFQDAYCGSKSYDGHQGTDYTIRSFRQMDSGVSVLAADSGIVTYILDGIFDRETVSGTTKGLGNYIAIKHPNNYYTYYGHLKKNSITVQVGDTIQSGRKIAEVGSSGNSSDPHLHFELWFDSLYVVDPFNGDCGNDSSLWLDSLVYDTSFRVWEKGLYLKNININTLREREQSSINEPYEIKKRSDTLSFWSHMYGLRNGDTLTIDWKDSTSVIQFSYDFITDRDYWYYYFWSYVLTDSLSVGDWQVLVSKNGEEIIQEKFEVNLPITTAYKEQLPSQKACLPYSLLMVSGEFENLARRGEVKVYQLNGVNVDPNVFFSKRITANFLPGFYIIQTHQKDKSCTYKVIR